MDDNGTLYLSDVCYKQTIELCQSFLDEVIIVARRRTQNLPKIVGIEDVHARFGLELPDHGTAGIRGIFKAFRLLFEFDLKEELSALLRDADLIYTENPSLEAYLAANIARKIGRHIVLEVRGDTILNYRYMFHRYGPAGLAYSWLINRLFTKARQQAVAGLYINESLQHSYPVAGDYHEAISDVRLPVELFSQPRQFIRPARFFLYVGHLEKVKRVDKVLRALKDSQSQFPADWRLDVVGDGPEWWALQRLGSQLGIESHINFHGRINWGESLFEFYRRSDLLMMASITEGSSRTLLEAMATGLPALSTAVGQAPELLDSCALAPVNDLSRYTCQLISMSSNPALLTQLSFQNWKRAQDFSLSVLTAKRKSFLLKALGLCAKNLNG